MGENDAKTPAAEDQQATNTPTPVEGAEEPQSAAPETNADTSTNTDAGQKAQPEGDAEKAGEDKGGDADKGEGQKEPPAEIKLDVPDWVPEEVKEVQAGNIKAFAELATKTGMTQEQAREVSDFFYNSVKADQDREVAFRQGYEDILRKSWGDKYDENIEMGNKAIHLAGGDAAVKFMQENPKFSNHPVVRHIFANIGMAISETAIPRKGGAGPSEIPRTPGGLPVLKYNKSGDGFK